MKWHQWNLRKTKNNLQYIAKSWLKHPLLWLQNKSVLGDLSEISMGEVVDFQLSDENKMTLQGKGWKCPSPPLELY